MSDDFEEFEDERVVDERLEFADYADYRAAFCNAANLLDQITWLALKHPYGVLPPAPDYLWYTYEYYVRSCHYYNSPPLSESRWNTLHNAYLAGLPFKERMRQTAYIAHLFETAVSS